MSMSPLVEKVAATALGAVLLGGGTTVLTNWRWNAVQDEQIVQLTERQKKSEQLLEALNETNTNIAVLNARLEWLLKNQTIAKEPDHGKGK